MGFRLTAMARVGSSELESYLRRWASSGEVTVAAAASTTAGRPVLRASWPQHSAPERQLFDAASLTKPFVATLAVQLAAAGRLPLELEIGEVWCGCASALARRRLGDLLRHRSGLIPWAPLYRRCRGRAGVDRLLRSGELLGAARPVYSDLGYIAWGFLAEEALGEGLRDLLERWVTRPLRLISVEVLPGARDDVVPCLCDNRAEVELAGALGVRVAPRPGPAIGEPQDGNARFLGGLAGHAGLFVGLDAVVRLGKVWLAAATGREGPLSAGVVRDALSGRGEYALGWARRRVRGSAGGALSPTSFGHTGFTGTSLWIDPERRRVHALLAHRSSALGDLNPARRRFHDLVQPAIPAARPPATRRPTSWTARLSPLRRSGPVR